MYERYVELLNEKGVKNIDVSRATGIPASTFSDWKKGKSSPKREKLEKLAEFFDVTADWIAGTSDCKTKEDWFRHCDDVFNTPELQADLFRIETGTKIPVLGEVAAGQPIFASEHHIGYEEISNEMKKTGEFFGLRIHGDSMSPRISDGDIVIVRQQDDAESGDIVIVLINGDSATCKKLMKYTDGISLLSFNPAYEPMTFTNKEIEDKPVRIIGKVVENRQKY